MTREQISKYRLTYIIRIAASLYLFYMVYDSLTNGAAKDHMTANIIISVICGAVGILFLVTGIIGFLNMSKEQKILDEREVQEEKERKMEEELRKENEEREKEEKMNSVEDRSQLLTFEDE